MLAPRDEPSLPCPEQLVWASDNGVAELSLGHSAAHPLHRLEIPTHGDFLAADEV
jgi:hypothetical protein